MQSMRKQKFNILVGMLILLVSTVATASEIGGQPGVFLRRGIGSRAIAMGMAYTSIANDASAIYWNPAGLPEIEKREFLGMFSFLTLDRQQMFFSFANNTSDIISIGVGWYKFGVTKIDGRDASGISTGKFNDNENSIMLSLGKRVGIFSAGITGKYLYHCLYDKSANGFGFDAGIKVQLFEMFHIGFVAQDIESQLKWNTKSSLKEKIPQVIRTGVSFQPDFLMGVASIEISKVGKEKIIYHAGAEYRIVEYFGIRVGYDGQNMSFGGLIKSPTEMINVQIDYAAIRDIIESDYVHHLTIKIGF